AATGIAGVAILAFVILIVSKLISRDSSSLGGAVSDVATYSQPIVSIGAKFHPFWKAVIEDGLSRLGFALVVLVLGLSLPAWRRQGGGRLVRSVGETPLVAIFSVTAEPPRWFRTGDARTAFARLKRLRWFDTSRIDVQQMVAKTVHAGGRPVVAFQRQRERP